MKRVIAFPMFREAKAKHPDCADQLELLYRDLRRLDFKNLNHVKECFPYVSILKNNRVCFNIHGNHYRVVVKFNFQMGACFIRFIGTHGEYDKIDANTV